jgi:Rrf2 family iron-sulfur cluster assembly transcriptional regulator
VARVGAIAWRDPTSAMTVADIIRAVDEPLDATQCGGRENCHDEERCMTHDLWATLNVKMFDYLTSVTLADLVASAGEQGWRRRRCPA